MGRRRNVYISEDDDRRLAALEAALPVVIQAGLSALEHERLGPPVTRRVPLASPPGRSLSAGEQQAAMEEARRAAGCECTSGGTLLHIAEDCPVHGDEWPSVFAAASLTVIAPCIHPRSARDPKNPSRCRCGALNLPEP